MPRAVTRLATMEVLMGVGVSLREETLMVVGVSLREETLGADGVDLPMPMAGDGW